jgi:hypothetical protein
MKVRNIIINAFILFVFITVPSQPLSAQGYGGPLDVHGIDNLTLHSSAVRGFGGVTIGMHNEIGLLFHNPASLHSLDGFQISVGGLQQSKDITQEQHFGPVRYYPNLSLLLEGLTDMIPDPVERARRPTAADTVQRPYDDIQPNWSNSNNDVLPIQAMAAIPFSLGSLKIVAGAGFVEYADLGHYYQNNNVLSPDVLSHRPLPVFRPTDDNPEMVDWYQTTRSRDGSVYGYGVALTGVLERYNLSLGVSGMILNGSTDDFEQEVGRGRLTFFSNSFRADSVYSRMTRFGTSDYSGLEFNLSGIHYGEYVSIGFSIKPPTTITRSFSMNIETDTTGTPVTSTLSGEDEIRLPWRGRAGIAIRPHGRLLLALEYEVRPYDSARYTDIEGVESQPWLSSSLVRAGIEYGVTSWLVLRGGIRGEAEVFEIKGNPIEGDPVSHTIYSGGVGIFFAGVRLNVAYENSNLQYEDIWGTALSKNKNKRHTIVADLSYTIPWIR